MPKGSPTEDLDSDGILDLTSAPSDQRIGPKAYRELKDNFAIVLIVFA